MNKNEEEPDWLKIKGLGARPIRLISLSWPCTDTQLTHRRVEDHSVSRKFIWSDTRHWTPNMVLFDGKRCYSGTPWN